MPPTPKPSPKSSSKPASKAARRGGAIDDILPQPGSSVASVASGDIVENQEPIREKMRMQTIYLRETSADLATDVEHYLKKQHHPELKGRLGLSFVISLGLDRLAEDFASDPASVLNQAVRFSQSRKPAAPARSSRQSKT